MASNKKPSIYSDRSSIGSADDLDEYGVWVKSGPQILSGSDDDLSSDFNAVDLPADDFAETGDPFSFDDAVLDVKAEGGAGFDDIDFPDDGIEIDAAESGTDLDLGEYSFKEDIIGEDGSNGGINIEDAQFEDFKTPVNTDETETANAADIDISADFSGADPVNDNLIDDSFDIDLDDISDGTQTNFEDDLKINADIDDITGSNFLSGASAAGGIDVNTIDGLDDITPEDINTDENDLGSVDFDMEDPLDIPADGDLGSVDLEFADNKQEEVSSDAGGPDSVDINFTEDSADNSGLTDISFDDDAVKNLSDDTGFADTADFDIPTVKSIENNADNTEKNYDAVQQNTGGDLSSILLQKIANELSSIRNELTDLKKEFAIARSGIQETAKTAAKDVSSQQAANGFFSEEDDETIALTGDELNNILATGESIEEQGIPETFDEDEGITVSLDDDDDETIALTGDELNNIIAASDENTEEQGIPEAFDEDEGITVSLDDDDDETIALTGDELNNIIAASDENTEEQGIPETFDEDEGITISLDDDDDETIALTGDELDNIMSSADFTEEAGTDVTAENGFSVDIDDSITIDDELINTEITADDLPDEQAMESDDALDAIDADSFDIDVSLDDSIDIDIPLDEDLKIDEDISIDIPLDDDALSNENIEIDIPLDDETGITEHEDTSLQDAISASAEESMAESHDDDIIFDEPILVEDLNIELKDDLSIQTGDSADEADAPGEDIAESIEIDDSIFSDTAGETEDAGISALDTNDSGLAGESGAPGVFDEADDTLNEAIKAANALADDDEVIIYDGLEKFREDGLEHMTETPENISYLEDSETADDLADLDLSDAVIDEPDLSAESIKDNLTEPAIDESEFDLDALNDLTIETPEEQEISLDVPEEEDLSLEEIDIGNFLEDESKTQEEEPQPEIEEEETVSQANVTITVQAAPPVQETEAASLKGTKPQAAPAPQAGQAGGGGSGPARQGKDGFQIPSELKSELRNILSYMDQLLESLPEEKIEEFAKSNYFDSYKKLFKDLGLV